MSGLDLCQAFGISMTVGNMPLIIFIIIIILTLSSRGAAIWRFTARHRHKTPDFRLWPDNGRMQTRGDRKMGAAHYYGQTVNKRRIDCIRECSADKYIPYRSVSFISVVTLSFNVQLRTALSPSYRFPSPIFHEIHPIELYDRNLCANR